MNEFVYLWRRPQRPAQTPQQMQEWMQKYQAWFRRMEETGHLAQYGLPLEANVQFMTVMATTMPYIGRG